MIIVVCGRLMVCSFADDVSKGFVKYWKVTVSPTLCQCDLKSKITSKVPISVYKSTFLFKFILVIFPRKKNDCHKK